MVVTFQLHALRHSLNESPSEKEGKSARVCAISTDANVPSMKVPPKRKGNPLEP